MSPARTLTRDEFVDTIADLKSDLRDDLRDISQRLDHLNGRTRASEIEIARLQTQLVGLEARALTRQAVAPAPEGHLLSTKAQAALVGSAVLVITALFKLTSVLAGVVGAKALEFLVKR